MVRPPHRRRARTPKSLVLAVVAATAALVTVALPAAFSSAAPGDPPVAVANVVPTRSYAPIAITFDGTASSASTGSTLASYAWDLSDGEHFDGALVTHSFDTPGTLTGTLTVTDSEGLTGSATFSFEIDDPATLRLPECGDVSDPADPIVERCDRYTLLPNARSWQVKGTGPVDVTFDWIRRNAGYNNELMVVATDDEIGTLSGSAPGTPEWRAKVLDQSEVVFPGGSDAFTPDKTLTFEGGKYLLFFISTQTLAELKQYAPNDPSRWGTVYFSSSSVNLDRTDHVRAYYNATDDLTEFGFEDLNGGGDYNLDDVLFTMRGAVRPVGNVTVSLQPSVTEVTAGGQLDLNVNVANAAQVSASVDKVIVTLPATFSYVPGSIGGAITTDPVITGSTLTWSGPFLLGPVGLNQFAFSVKVGSTAGTFTTSATAAAGAVPVTPSGDITITVKPAGPLCNGKVATIVGAGVINGTPGPDVIVGSAGRDTINGLGGNDTICALGGNDVVNGGDGDDWLSAGDGNDVVDAGNGNDFVDGGTGLNVLMGGPGDDAVHGGPLSDKIGGGTGNDLLDGAGGFDQCWAQGGTDTFSSCEYRG